MEIIHNNRTQKDINQEIKVLEAKIDDIQNIRKHSPELVELESKIRKIKDEYYEKNKVSISCLESDIQALKKELKNKKEGNGIILSERIKKWFREYQSGVQFGYKDPKIVWVSEDERFVIITSPGGIAGTGTAMGTGAYYYAASTHWLTEVIDGKKYRENASKWMEHEGRLTKEVKQKMIEYTHELRNKNE